MNARGFTLLEVMVAMTLFTLLIATAYTGLRVGARSVAATDERAGVAEELAMVTRIFETYLSSAQPVLRRQDTRDGRRRAVEFAGNTSEVSFLAEMPARIGYGGLYQITLRFAPGEDDDDGTVLEFERRLYNADPEAELDGAAATRRVLLTGLDGGSFAYFGAEQRRERPDWREEWQDMRAPPLAVRAEFEDAQRAWPTLMLPVRLQALRAVRSGSDGDGGGDDDEVLEDDGIRQDDENEDGTRRVRDRSRGGAPE